VHQRTIIRSDISCGTNLEMTTAAETGIYPHSLKLEETTEGLKISVHVLSS